MNEVLVEIRRADITTISADAIVVTADPSLKNGGMLFQAAMARGGMQLRALCNSIGSLGPTGIQQMNGFGLSSRLVLFVALPKTTEDALEAIERAMDSAHNGRLVSIAFPPIGINLVVNNVKKYTAHVQAICDTIFRIAHQLKELNSSIRSIIIAVDSQNLELDFQNEAELISVIYSTRPLPQSPKPSNDQSTTRLPRDWTPMDKLKPYQFVSEAVSSCSVYKECQEEIAQELQNGWSLHLVYRLQNPTLYETYLKFSERLELKYRNEAGAASVFSFVSSKSKTDIEKRLWHGTRADAVEKIADAGFDRSFAGANMCAYGQGSYFARDLKYSFSDTYSVPGPALPLPAFRTAGLGARFDRSNYEYKYIFRARVLVGKSCVGNSAMRYLPNNADGTQPDSAVDSLAAPKIFVVFKDMQAYPEHLFVFSRRKQPQYPYQY